MVMMIHLETNNKPFFWSASEKQTDWWKTCWNIKKELLSSKKLLHYLYNKNYYNSIGIDLWRQTNTSIPEQIYFVGKLEEDDSMTIFFYCQEAAKKNSEFFFRFISCDRITNNEI